MLWFVQLNKRDTSTAERNGGRQMNNPNEFPYDIPDIPGRPWDDDEGDDDE